MTHGGTWGRGAGTIAYLNCDSCTDHWGTDGGRFQAGYGCGSIPWRGEEGGVLGGWGATEKSTRAPTLHSSKNSVVRRIWFTFSTTKDFDLYWVEIEQKMEKWAWDKGVEIDLALYPATI